MVRFNHSMQVLNKKDQKEIRWLIMETWGADMASVVGFGGSSCDDLALFLSQKDRLYLAPRSVEKAPLSSLRINSIGCYVGEYKGGDLRLSIEGTQLIGPHATKNMVELTSAQTEQWMKGETILMQNPGQANLTGFVLLRKGKDWLGCGKATPDGKILNFVPKTRRIRSSDLPSSPAEG